MLPGITATMPADGSVLVQAPQSLTITFDQSVVDQIDNAFSGMFSIAPDQVLPSLINAGSGLDVEIDRIGADGSVTPYLGGASTSPVVETVATTTAANGASETQLVVTLPPGSPALAPSAYQLDIVPGAALASAFGMIEPTSAWASISPQPIPIAGFTILGQGATLGGATDVGPIGPTTLSVSGSLDPGDYRSAVALYRITLPPGNHWRLNAQVEAQALGSPLLSAMALFDAQGELLATRDVGAGTFADPIDPDLITNLEPGTYYIGVSAGRNLPGNAGGYEPVTGTPGIVGLNERGGPFVLDLTATPTPPPINLVGMNLDYADALEPSPTGLDLSFSGPVDVSALSLPDQQETALLVVNSSGKVWPITAVDYQPAQDRLSFLFNEPLPAGSYSLVVPSQGGLTDLAGGPVLGPATNPPGVLASWTVAVPSGPGNPDNLGVLWPGPVNVTWHPAVSGSTTLAAGQESEYRFVVIVPGIYEVQTQINSGADDVQIQNGDGATLIDVGSLTGVTDSYMDLEPGVYRLQLTNEGSGPSTVEWSLRPIGLDYEKILENGVGQTAALGLSLIGPPPEASGSSSNSASSGGAANSVISAGGAPASGGSSPAAVGLSPIPITPLVTLETGLAGLPAPGAGLVAAVGPQSEGATVALSDAGRGPTQGVFSLLTSGTDPRVGEGNPVDGPDSVTPAPLAQIGSTEPAVASDPEAASARADAMALARADGMVRLAAWISDRIAVAPTGPGEADLPSAGFGTTLLAAVATTDGGAATGDATAGGPGRGRRRETFTQADLGAPFILLVGTALSYRLSKPIRKWWRWYHAAHAAWPRPFAFRRGAMPASSRL
jgi:hypothetical protein